MTSFSVQSAILPELLEVSQIGQKQPKMAQKQPYLAFICNFLKNYPLLYLLVFLLDLLLLQFFAYFQY